jgi:hypothetical protein
MLPILGIHDLFGTEFAMIFSFHVGVTNSVTKSVIGKVKKVAKIISINDATSNLKRTDQI